MISSFLSKLKNYFYAHKMVYNSSINNLNSPENRNEFYLVVCFTTIMFSLSILGAIYVLYRTYKSWVYSEDSFFFNKRCLNMSHKLPFYTSCIGLLF